jgi:AcrR family transcriptional regulator
MQAVPSEENGYQRRKRETRTALMAASRGLFIDKGVEHVSIESITAAAGVAKGSFYNHFDSREALFEELIEVTVADLLAKWEAYDPAHEDPLINASEKARYTFYTLLSDPSSCHLLLQAGQPTQGGAIDRVLRLVLRDKMSEGIALGSVRHLDPDLVYAAYFGVVTETIGHLLTREEELDARSGADQVTELCFAVLGLPHQPPQKDILER